MPQRKNVLPIVLDQWRADVVPRLGAGHLRTPTLDRLYREGVTWASLPTGLPPMHRRRVQNMVPLDAPPMALGRALRRIGCDPAHAGLVKQDAQRALSWRLHQSERTLTQFRATSQGLAERQPIAARAQQGTPT